MKSEIIASEVFSSGKRYYFLDLIEAKNKTRCLRITRSDELAEGSFHRKSIVLFEEDLELFIQGLSSLFHHARFKD